MTDAMTAAEARKAADQYDLLPDVQATLRAYADQAEEIKQLREALRAIEFARSLDDAFNAKQFLEDWTHGDLAHWPEYQAALESSDHNARTVESHFQGISGEPPRAYADLLDERATQPDVREGLRVLLVERDTTIDAGVSSLSVAETIDRILALTAPKAKGLVWREETNRIGIEVTAKTAFGEYFVGEDGEDDAHPGRWWWQRPDGTTEDDIPTLDLARAAAEEHWQASWKEAMA